MSTFDWTEQFENRKRDHIRLALDPRTQVTGGSGLAQIELIHEALPDLNLEDISLKSHLWGVPLASPLFVSSMTAGHGDGHKINLTLAEACAQRGWAMGVGSQRRELRDPAAHHEWSAIRRQVPHVVLMGNIGISQLIQTSSEQIQRLVDNMQATCMIVHTNPLQECLQPEGSPQFRGGLEALSRLARELSVPVVVKETGCGFSRATLARLNDSGVQAVDIGGLGGTHWGRVEGQRSEPGSQLYQVAETFADWGVSTVQSLSDAIELRPHFAVWASGGVRSGLDAAKLLAMGAQHVGLAKPMMEAALQGVTTLLQLMERLEYELKVALFCTGCSDLQQLREKHVWRRK